MTKVFQHFYDGALPAQQTFSRSSVASYITASGQLALAPSDTPRFETTGLFLEPAATQHISSPADLAGAGWSNTGGTITANVEVLWGLLSVSQVTTNGALWHNRNTVTPGVAADDVRSYAFIVKAGGTDPSGKVRFVFDGGGTADASALTGTIGDELLWSVANAAHIGALNQKSRIALADGWYLYQFSITFTATYSSVTVRIGAQDTVAGRSVLVAGANSTDLSVPSSFILGASRAADMLGTIAMGQVLNQGAFVVGVTLPYMAVEDQSVAGLRLSTDPNQSIRADIDASSAAVDAIAVNAVDVSNLAAGQIADERVVLAQRFKTNDFAAAANGAAAIVDTVGIAPSVDSVFAGSSSASTPIYLEFIAVHDVALNNAALVAESARTLFQRDTVAIASSASGLSFTAFNQALLAGIDQVNVGLQRLVISGSGFLAKPASLLRRHSPSARQRAYEPKP